jgi:hypothetical protein
VEVLGEHEELCGVVKEVEFRVPNASSIISRRTLVSFLESLPSLATLSISDTAQERVHTALLPSSSPVHYLSQHQDLKLPSLVRLTIRPSSEWKNVFDPRNYRFLNNSPKLRTLVLETDFHSNPPSPPNVPSSELPACFSQITSLEFKGPHRLEGSSIGRFSSLFSNLVAFKNFRFTHSNPHQPRDLATVFSLLPVSLQHLETSTRGFNDTVQSPSPLVDHPCDPCFARLQSLRSLTLEYGTVSNDILVHLSKLPHLETLVYGPGTLPNPAHLNSPTYVPPSIKTIVFQGYPSLLDWNSFRPFKEAIKEAIKGLRARGV